MSKKLYEEQSLSAIASSIRRKNGSNDTYKVSEMAEAIDAITLSLQEKTITENGIILPDSGYVGFQSVVVSVPPMPPKQIVETVGDIEITDASDAQAYSAPFAGEAYIESHGTEYIDTEYTPNSNTKVIMRCRLHPSNKSYACPFGGRATNSPTGAFAAYRQNNSNAIYTVQYGSKSYNGTGLILGGDVVITLCKDYLSTVLGDIISTQYNITSLSGSPSAHLYLFALCQGSAPEGTNTYCIMRLYECFIYEGESLEHHYIPAIGVNDEACLYDTVTETYLYNRGTGAFTYVEAEE